MNILRARIVGSIVGTLLFAAASELRAADAVQALQEYLAAPAAVRPPWAEQSFVTQALSKADAERVRQLMVADSLTRAREERAGEWKTQAIVAAGQTMKFVTKTYGTRPAAGWDLYISLHGGGSTPPEVNDQQWQNQQTLYKPANSMYIAPRAPTNSWDLWHQPHVDVLIGRLIEDAILFGGANPNRVYLMGYSAGGDGVYQLAPRMADRFAAAAMMAGHPNDASPLGLRNLPFTIHVGALDTAYERNKVAMDWNGKLDALQKADRSGYTHEVQIHEGRGHWMQREDAVALQWMAKYDRNTQPARVVWVQGRAVHDRFYWLAAVDGTVKPGATVDVERDGQTIRVLRAEGVEGLSILLNDSMLDLDRPVTIRWGETILFNGVVPRTASSLRASLAARLDPDAVFTATVTIRFSDPPRTFKAADDPRLR